MNLRNKSWGSLVRTCNIALAAAGNDGKATGRERNRRLRHHRCAQRSGHDCHGDRLGPAERERVSPDRREEHRAPGLLRSRDRALDRRNS